MEEKIKEETLFESISRSLSSLDNEENILYNASSVGAFIDQVKEKATLKKMLDIEDLNDKILNCIQTINALYHSGRSKDKLVDILNMLKSNTEFDYFKGYNND